MCAYLLSEGYVCDWRNVFQGLHFVEFCVRGVFKGGVRGVQKSVYVCVYMHCVHVHRPLCWLNLTSLKK